MNVQELRDYFTMYGNLPIGEVEKLLDIAEAFESEAKLEEVYSSPTPAPKKRGKAAAE